MKPYAQKMMILNRHTASVLRIPRQMEPISKQPVSWENRSSHRPILPALGLVEMDGPANGILSLSASSSEMDTTLALFAGWSLDDLILCAENNNENSSTTNSALSFEVSQGIEYSIMVSGNEGSQGAFFFGTRLPGTLPGEQTRKRRFCIGQKTLRISLPILWVTTDLQARRENEGILSYNQSKPINSVWWHWQSPATGTARVSLAGSEFDTLLKVFEGSSLSNLILIG